MNAYMALTTCRTDKGSVPWTAIAQYSQFYGFDLEQLDTLVYFCGKLDAEFRSWEKATNPNKPSKPIGKSGNHKSLRIR